MTERTKQLRKHKQNVTFQGNQITQPQMTELFGLIESLLRTMDETGTFELGFQGEYNGGTVEMSACRHRFDVEWEGEGGE